MAMSKRTERELAKNRELLWHLLDDIRCFFCRKPLLNVKEMVKADLLRFGDGTAPPISEPITIHHVDENHGNNERSNRALAHRRCHLSHHAKQRKAVA